MKITDKVCFKHDLDKNVYRIYAIYTKSKVSLGLLHYPDVEQDCLVDIRNLEIYKK